jgi:hypothetical protein
MQGIGVKRPRDESAFTASAYKSVRLHDGANARWPGACRTPQCNWPPVRACLRVRTRGRALEPADVLAHASRGERSQQQPHGATSAVATLLYNFSPGPKFGGAKSVLRREVVHARQATPFRATPSGAGHAQRGSFSAALTRTRLRSPPPRCSPRAGEPQFQDGFYAMAPGTSQTGAQQPLPVSHARGVTPPTAVGLVSPPTLQQQRQRRQNGGGARGFGGSYRPDALAGARAPHAAVPQKPELGHDQVRAGQVDDVCLAHRSLLAVGRPRCRQELAQYLRMYRERCPAAAPASTPAVHRGAQGHSRLPLSPFYCACECLRLTQLFTVAQLSHSRSRP